MLAGAARPTQAETIQRYARATGIAMLLSVIFGALGEAYLPGRIIVGGDAAATAANIAAHPTLFRMAFATYLVEGFCDIILCVLWYIVLKPVNRNLALLSAFVGVVSMVTFMPMALGGIPLAFWLILKGVDRRRLEAVL